MTLPLLPEAIAALRPGAQWVLRGPTLADLQWLDQVQTRPTQAEIDAYVPLPPLVDPISDRQFYQQAAVDGYITQAEALAAVQTGTIPSTLLAMVATLPSDQQFGATMLLAGATQFYRQHPMTLAFMALRGMTSDQGDAFWRAAGAL